MKWLADQIYHYNILNILSVLVIVACMIAINNKNMVKELKSISEEIYKNSEEVKDEIREKKEI